MATYFLFGKYTPGSIRQISGERTGKASRVIDEIGGKTKAMYALLGEHDLVLIVEFPGMPEAMQASVSLCSSTGIAFSTSPAIPVDDFDKLISQ